VENFERFNPQTARVESKEISKKKELIKAKEFNGSLNSLRFDRGFFASAMYDRIANSGSNAYTQIKSDILRLNKRFDEAQDSSMSGISVEEFNNYINSKGGDRFLKLIFKRGVADLKRDFKRQAKDLAADKALMVGTGWRSEAFRGSVVAQKINIAAEKHGGLDALTFEQLFDEGFYGEAMQPTFEGVAEYGLTFWEYSERRRNRDAIKRAAVAKRRSLLTTRKKSPEPVAPVPAPVPAPAPAPVPAVPVVPAPAESRKEAVERKSRPVIQVFDREDKGI